MASDDDFDEGPPEDRPMTLREHLEELRKRVLRSVLILVVGAAVAFYFQDQLLAIVVAPVADVLERHQGIGTMQVRQVGELFFSSVKISLVLGLFATAPFVGHQLWQFVATGLYPRERRYVTLFAPLSYLLFMGGAAFFYFVFLPQVLEILLTWNMGKMAVEVNPELGAYLGVFLGMALVMGLVFQLPIMMMILQLTGLITWQTFSRYRRHFIVASLILAAVLTPTGDAISLGLMMVPVIILFEVGLLICRMIGRRKDARAS